MLMELPGKPEQRSAHSNVLWKAEEQLWPPPRPGWLGRCPGQLLLNTLLHPEAPIWHTAEDGENTFIFMDLLRLGIVEVIK